MENYLKNMARFPDEELLRIAYPVGTDDYEAEAVAAARHELGRRGISEDERFEVQTHVVAEQAAEEGRRHAPLSNDAWVFFMFFGPLLPLSGVALASLWMLGYRQKVIDALSAILMGFAFWGLILAVIVVLILFSG